MKTTAAALLLALTAIPAAAGDFSGRADVSYQNYDIGRVVESGIRQSYDLRLDRAFTGNSRLRLFFRAEDFQGSSQFSPGFSQNRRSREYQPSGELLINAETLRLLLRADYTNYEGETERFGSSRSTERAMGRFEWAPTGLPRLAVLAQRSSMSAVAGRGPEDEVLLASVTYPWRGLNVGVNARFIESADYASGYERANDSYGGTISYSFTTAGNRLSIATSALSSRTSLAERSISGEQVSVPVPVAIAQALFAVDETPQDGQDRPLHAAPLLKDGDVDTSANIALGPDGESFTNLALDIGRIERIDEVRVTIRDSSGNLVRSGGGAVTWDVYLSDDGTLWKPVSGAETTFHLGRSAYLVSFPEVQTRWVKVVSFGVLPEPAYVTEAEAFHHLTVDAGSELDGEQQSNSAAVNATWRPVDRLTLSYGGAYSASKREYLTRLPDETTSLDHLLGAELALGTHWSVRTQGSLRTADGYGLGEDTSSTIMAALDFHPTKRLQIALEANRQTQSALIQPGVLELVALRAVTQPLRHLTVNADIGVQRQTLEGIDGGRRFFANISSSSRLTRTTRLLLTASLQRAVIDEESAVLLGSERDDRISADLTWQPGRPLMITTRIGYVSSEILSGITTRVRTDWTPFEGGAVSLSGSYDEDIDPMSDRRSRRLLFAPRWTMNRFMTLHLNYTWVSTVLQSYENEQRSLYATLSVTR